MSEEISLSIVILILTIFNRTFINFFYFFGAYPIMLRGTPGSALRHPPTALGPYGTPRDGTAIPPRSATARQTPYLYRHHCSGPLLKDLEAALLPKVSTMMMNVMLE